MKNILNYFVPIVILVVFIVPLFVCAQCADGTTTCLDGGGGNNIEGGAGGGKTSLDIVINNPFKQDTIKGLIETIVNDILMPIGGVIAVLMIMYAGFMYVTAKGDPGKIKTAHDALLWAVIGAAILLGAWVISQAIGATIDQLKT